MSEFKKVPTLLDSKPPSWSDPFLLLNKTPCSPYLILATLVNPLPRELVLAHLPYPNFTNNVLSFPKLLGVFPQSFPLLISGMLVRYQSLMDLRQVCPTPPSSTILSVPKVHSYFRHISDTPLFVPVSPCLTLRPYVPCFTDICFYATMILSSLA